LDHREPGILGVVLTTPSLYAELICDGIHTAPEIVQLWRSAKGPHRSILVTDAMSAAGMPDGEYQLGGFTVQVANGRAMARGVLAGSVLTLDRALTNYIAFTGASLQESLPLLTVNPATMAGLTASAGSLTPGSLANFVVLEKSGSLRASILDGQRAA
ncbi:MAG: amidohydrolase family protein, partial [Terracidiphilus sp.]